MATVPIRPVSELQPTVERILAGVYAQLAALLPDAEVHHVGATAIPGALTKGDVDLLVRVSSARFPTAVQVLKRHYAVKQPGNWTATFASFGDDAAHQLPLGIQVVVAGSEYDFFLFLRDYLIAHHAELEEYNRLKTGHAPEGPEGYWEAKNRFLERVLKSRPES